MRIGFMSDNISMASGYGKVTKYLAEGLKEEGFGVSQFALHYAGNPIIINGIKVYQGVSLAMLPRYIDEERPDILIHIRDNWVFTSFFPGRYDIINFCKWKRVKVVLYTPTGESPVPREFIQPCLQADLTLTISNWCRKQLVRAGAPAEKVETLYHGVNTEIFKPLQVKKAEMGFDESPLVGMVGINSTRKDFPRVLRVYARLLQKHRVQLHLQTQPIKADGFDLAVYLEQLGLKGKVSFPDPPIDTWWGADEQGLSRLYNCMTTYVHCSKAEGFGLPMLEAMACGTPVVASDNTGIPEILGGAGLLVPCPTAEYMNFGGNYWLTDEQKLYEALLSTLEEPELRRSLSKKALARAREPIFSWKNITKRLIDMLNNL